MSGQLHTPEYQQFLARLKAARKQAGFTQLDAAQRLGKPQSYISKCESGERRVDAVELAAFATLYGVKVDELLSDGGSCLNV
ncbi:MAG: helix-turn-helix transcriptional regulator [Chloroflexaceae bacterium]|nr:helix-turn-helix transcriptional regulator [Chloroflexaceae bacterium]